MSDWQRVKSIFEEIIELPEPEREPALERFCSGDAAVRAAVSDLLAAHDSAGEFLHAPTMNPAGEERLAALAGAPQCPTPTQIGPYTLLEVIGEGGFGTVYRAEQQEPVRRVVALKVIKPGMDSREVIARFEGERQALAMMNHPHIAAVLDAGATADRRPYFVMEYVPGKPITRYCDDHALSIGDRLGLFVQVCQAVQHAHQKGIIHRDIKPSNVLVVPAPDSPQHSAGHSTHSGSAARAKVIDFGVAKATDQRLTEHTVNTQQGMFLGTPAYMSPEQAGVGPLDIDTRTDIYSLGVLLYELLTGAPPFDPRSLLVSSHSEIQRIIREVDPPRPSTRLSTLRDKPDGGGDTPASPSRIAAQRQTDARSLIRHLRGDLDWIVMKCLEKDRARRYETANDVALEIERYLNHEPVKAGPPSLTYRLGKFTRRNRAAFIAVTGIALALLVGLAISIAGFLAARRARDVADAQRVLAVQSAEEALRAARKAETVTQFLQETLAAADPKVSARRDMTVREALNQAVAKLDAGSMGEQPETEAAIRMTIGRAWMGLAQYAEAEEQVERALALYRAKQGDEGFDSAEALQLRGSVRSLAGRLEEAERDFRAALAAQRARRPAGHAAVAACLNDLATTITSQGRYDEAAAMLTEALEISRRAENERESVLPEVVNNLGLVYLLQKNWTSAQPLFHEAVRLNQRLLGRLHPNIATNLDNLAQSYQGKGDLDSAEKHYREAIAMRRELFGSDHPDVAASLHNIATLLWIRGDRAGAEKAVRESLDIFRRVHGPAHPDVVRVVHSLVSVVGARGLYDEADSLMAETFEAVRNAPDVTFDDKLSLAKRLVELHEFRKDSEKAAEWARNVRALQATTQPATTSMPGAAD
ncbi:MAG: hypothetical protein DCC65_06225 [Planctomycetota bacterium]|nr:MAG: hypothetical protein DCC65_06225 [Planctomycetota bacterium]